MRSGKDGGVGNDFGWIDIFLQRHRRLLLFFIRIFFLFVFDDADADADADADGIFQKGLEVAPTSKPTVGIRISK